MQVQNLLFIVTLIISIIIHELAHGYAADSMGDPTPRLAGRLTWNPIVHMDLFGSIILPALLIFSGAPFVLGWAKPVPFNPYRLNNQKWGGALVALAGPLSNIALAGVFALLLRFFTFSPLVMSFMVGVVVTNIALAVFNLVPIPPLDGHHILFSIIPERFQHIKESLRRYSFVILIIFVIYGWKFISPVIMYLVKIFLG